MPGSRHIGHALALQYLSRRPRPPFVRGNGDLLLPQPVRSVILVPKPPSIRRMSVHLFSVHLNKTET
jgi:hypothetical protein